MKMEHIKLRLFEDNLNKFDLSIFKKDLYYRIYEINKYYYNFESSKENEFLYYFCAHQNISKLSIQISNIFSSNEFKST
ncbi:MAG: hypothetical protein HRU03_08830, partial [Nanoarchaeales archaeon]|nr:hypothetical protein [Nanoarchaeales archaeon]